VLGDDKVIWGIAGLRSRARELDKCNESKSLLNASLNSVLEIVGMAVDGLPSFCWLVREGPT